MNRKEKSAVLSTIGIERGDKVTRLEAFVDASFAFAVTLLVIAGDQIPTSIAMLQHDLKQIPTYAASFLLIMQFWTNHADWSRRFGLEDRYSDRLSLVLVFVLLIFVYPLKMVFGSFFSMLSGGYLPSGFSIDSWSEVPVLFQTFALGFGAMALVMFLLFSRAAQLGPSLAFAQSEIDYAKFKCTLYGTVVIFCVISFILTLVIPATAESGIWVGTPGFIFFVLNIIQTIMKRKFQNKTTS
jgi:Endosomal/lysosomal potassium channel TMEM175